MASNLGRECGSLHASAEESDGGCSRVAARIRTLRHDLVYLKLFLPLIEQSSRDADKNDESRSFFSYWAGGRPLFFHAVS
jgi:hypothetical protein